MSKYESLAIILAAIALGWSIIYAIYNEIRRWRNRKPKIKVQPSYSVIPALFPSNPTLLKITIKNRGERLSRLNRISLVLQDGPKKTLLISQPRSDQPFPYELTPGDSYSCWVLKDDLRENAEIAYWDMKRVRVDVGDMAGWTYRSLLFTLDLSKLG